MPWINLVVGFLAAVVGIIAGSLYTYERLKRIVPKRTPQDVVKIPKGMVIFITGTNGAGKTTVTAELAKKWSL